VNVKQVVSQKVVVKVGCCGNKRRKRKRGRKRAPRKQSLPKGGAYYDPFPQRLLATYIQQNRTMPQFMTPRAAAVRPAIPGVVRGDEQVNPARRGGDILGGRAMPNRWRNDLGQDAWDAQGVENAMSMPTGSMTSSRGVPSSVGEDTTIDTDAHGRVYVTRHEERRRARVGLSMVGGHRNLPDDVDDAILGQLGAGAAEPYYGGNSVGSSWSGSSISGGTASSGSSYGGSRTTRGYHAPWGFREGDVFVREGVANL